jgi:hypothetical protein
MAIASSGANAPVFPSQAVHNPYSTISAQSLSPSFISEHQSYILMMTNFSIIILWPIELQPLCLTLNHQHLDF